MDGTPVLSVWTWLAAASPIVVLLILMVGFNWGGARAGAAGWLVAFGVAFTVFGANDTLVALANTKAILLSIWVLYIIWAALFLYHIVNEAGAVQTIGDGLLRVTGNKVLQLLLLAWAFTSFLQGISGYGVPVAVVAPLMTAIGFSPVIAVVTTSIGHSWAVTFGSLAASFYSLVGVTGIDANVLAGPVALMLGFTAYLAGTTTVWAYGGYRAAIRATPLVLILGTAMAVTQWAMASLGFYSIASFTGGLVGIALGIILTRLPMFGRSAGPRPVMGGEDAEVVQWPKVFIALSAYLVLIAIVLIVNLIAPVGELLDRVAIDLSFPATSTSFGWTNDATDSYRSIELLSHGGALLLYAAVIGYFIYRRAGLYTPGAFRRSISKTVKAAVPSSLGIVALVGMALIMMESGMTYLLARGLADVAGDAFPFLAPFVGVLGTFMTGSNTNSNILFGALQRDTATLLGLPVTTILAAQTTGGALGGILAPAKLVVGCSTVGLSGNEGPVIRVAVRYGLAMTLVIGLVTLVAVALWG